MTVIEPTYEAPKILTEAQRRAERLSNLCAVYQTADRVLSGETLTVRAEYHDGCPAAGWTDGARTVINSAVVADVDLDTVELIHGVNAHELGHILYTPRQGTTLVSWVLDHRFHQEFNILEDQRIETLLTARYASTVSWLKAAIARWVINGDCSDTGYLMVRGRRYLSGDLRGSLRASFKAQELLPDVDRIIDEYRLLAFPSGYEEAKVLIEEFAELLKKLREPSDGDGDGDGDGKGDGDGRGKVTVIIDPNGHSGRPIKVLTDGRPKGVTEQRKTIERADEGEPEVIDLRGKDVEFKVVEPEDGQDGDDSEPTDGEPTDGEPTDGEPTDGDEGPSGDAEDDTETSGGGASKDDGVGAVQEIAQRILQEIHDDPEIIKDLQRTLRTIRGAGGSDIITGANWSSRAPLSEYVGLFKTLRRSLARLVTEADPGWFTREASGRVNAIRWIKERDIDSAFDRWDEGVDNVVDLEVVIMLDESGSMREVMEQAVNSMWVVKRSLDRIGASTTVITFDGQSRVLYHRRDKADGNIRYSFRSGGTNPSDGLAQAARIFARSEKSQKILIVFTDGQWGVNSNYEGVTPDEYIKRMTAAGVVTGIGFIVDQADMDGKSLESTEYYDPKHGCQVSSYVHGTGLVRFISAIVTKSIQDRLIRK
jgi:hypothetical protein